MVTGTERKRDRLLQQRGRIAKELDTVEKLLENTPAAKKWVSKKHFPIIDGLSETYLLGLKALQKGEGGLTKSKTPATRGLNIMVAMLSKETGGLDLHFLPIKKVEEAKEFDEDPKSATFMYYYHKIKKIIENDDRWRGHIRRLCTASGVLPTNLSGLSKLLQDGNYEEQVMEFHQAIKDTYPPEKIAAAQHEFNTIHNDLKKNKKALDKKITALSTQIDTLSKDIADEKGDKLARSRDVTKELLDIIIDLGAEGKEVCKKASKHLKKEITNLEELRAAIDKEEDLAKLSGLRGTFGNIKAGLERTPTKRKYPLDTDIGGPITIQTEDFIKEAKKIVKKIKKKYVGREKSLLADQLQDNVEKSKELLKSMEGIKIKRQRRIFIQIKQNNEEQKTIVGLLIKADKIHKMVAPERMDGRDNWAFVELNILTKIFTGKNAFQTTLKKHVEAKKWKDAKKLADTLQNFLKKDYKKVAADDVPESKKFIPKAIGYILKEKYDKLEKLYTDSQEFIEKARAEKKDK